MTTRISKAEKDSTISDGHQRKHIDATNMNASEQVETTLVTCSQEDNHHINESIPIHYLTAEAARQISLENNSIPTIVTDGSELNNSAGVVYYNVVAQENGLQGISENTILVGAESEDGTNTLEITIETEDAQKLIDSIINEGETEKDVDHPSHLHVCPRCRACFATSSYLKTHMKRKCVRSLNIGNQHECSYCTLSFKHNHQLTRHMMQHTGERPFKCEGCEKTFLTKSHLKRHAVIHEPDNEAVYKCTQCNKVFAWHSALNAHMKSHTGEKRFKCGICGRMFLHLNSLRSHMTNRHTVNGKYTCVVCKENYDEPTDLILHMKTHNEQESVKCDSCYAFFSSLKDLETHLCTNFGGKPLICYICKIEFPDTNDFCNHKCMQVNTNRICICCNKTLKSLWHLREHLITHTGEKPFKCIECLTTFRRKRELQIHMTRHSAEKPFRCSQCTLTFSSENYMKQHMRKEHREKKFVCEICSHPFMHKCSLTNHMSFHIRTGNTKFGKKYHRDDGMLVDELVKERLELEGKGTDEIEIHSTASSLGASDQPTTTSSSLLADQTSLSNKKDEVNVGDLVINIPSEQNGKQTILEVADHDDFSKGVIEPNSTNSGDDPSNITAIYRTEQDGSIVMRCATCMQDFSSHGKLLRHRKEFHNDGKPYQCEFCSRTFAVAANLSQHRNIHNIKRKYSCCRCGKSYKITHKLREHLRIKHGENTVGLTDLELRLRNSGDSSFNTSVFNEVLVDSLLSNNSFMTSDISDGNQTVNTNAQYHFGNSETTTNNQVQTVNTALFEAVRPSSNTSVDGSDNRNLLSNLVFLEQKGEKPSATSMSPEQLSRRSDVSFLMNLSSLITELGDVGSQRIVLQEDVRTPTQT